MGNVDLQLLNNNFLSRSEDKLMNIDTVFCQTDKTYDCAFKDADTSWRSIIQKKAGETLNVSIYWSIGPVRLRVLLQSPEGDVVKDEVNHPAITSININH